MDKGAWWTAVHEVAKERDMTWPLNNSSDSKGIQWIGGLARASGKERWATWEHGPRVRSTLWGKTIRSTLDTLNPKGLGGGHLEKDFQRGLDPGVTFQETQAALISLPYDQGNQSFLLETGLITDFLLLEDNCVLSYGLSSGSLTTAQILLQQPFAVFAVSWARWCVGSRPGVEVSSWTFLCLEAPSLKPLSNQTTRDQGFSCWGGPGGAWVISRASLQG